MSRRATVILSAAKELAGSNRSFLRSILGMTRAISWRLAALLSALTVAGAAQAATVTVEANPGALAAAVAKAAPGDRLVLAPGRYDGPVTLAKPITLEGQPGAEVVGPGTGSVIKVQAADVTVRGLIIRGSGRRPMDFDSAIYVAEGADRFVAEGNRLEGNEFGVVLRHTRHAVVSGNTIDNRTDAYETELGDGIFLTGVHDTVVKGNRLHGGRDGIFSEVSDKLLLEGNRIEGVRFAIHYMYTNHTRILGNLSEHNRLGYALMYSNAIDVERNLSIDDDRYGLMLHTTYHSVVADNWLRGTKEKCLFVYTSAKDVIRNNRIEDCPVGLHFTGGSEDNAVYGNAFINNRTQVKYTGTVYYEWSKDGRGNYWSDNPAFDLKGNGIAASAYRPNSVMDRLLWRYPLAKLLVSSPVMEALKVAQSQFPALMPGGVIDSHPLMAPPPLPADLPQPDEGRS